MSVNSHLFADRIVNLAVTGPLIRIELAAHVPPVKEGDKPGLQATQTLVMPLDGFLQSFGMLEAVVKKMIADGVLKAHPAPVANPIATAPDTQQ